MKRYVIKAKKRTLDISSSMRLASGFFDRLIGLMFKKKMPKCDALVIDSCISVHTCFMFFSIDVIFVNDKGVIVKIIRDMKPWRFSGMYFRASRVIEMVAGTFPQELQKGDEVEFLCIS